MIRITGYVGVILVTVFIVSHVYCVPMEETTTGVSYLGHVSQ